ncbi:flagellin [Inconstantimicrobium porci]|nr:flagellin [Inconstantimicrobium porci]
MRLSHNLASLSLYRKYSKDLKDGSVALGRITSGQKINSSKEGATKIGQSELLRVQIRGLEMARRNTQDGASMMQTVDGAMDSITTAIKRIKELSVQAANGTNTDIDKQSIQEEIDAMKAHINTTAKNTEFNGVKLLDDKYCDSIDNPSYYDMMSGANVGENIKIPMYKVNTSTLTGKDGTPLDKIDVMGSPEQLQKNLDIADGALTKALQIRSKYGALQQRFESVSGNNEEFSAILQNAESSIRDADLAEEMLNYSKNDILINASIAMMTQSNNLPQDALKILERVK